ncbi:hypothetical protein COCCADRAFT_98513, partial [Bipolaris zeicola 26-R-13]
FHINNKWPLKLTLPFETRRDLTSHHSTEKKVKPINLSTHYTIKYQETGVKGTALSPPFHFL